MNHREHGGHREEGTISFPLGSPQYFWYKPLRSLCSLWCNKVHPSCLLLPGYTYATPGKLLLLLLLLLAPAALTAQSPELVQAKAQVKALSEQLEELDETIAQELAAALAGQIDTSPKGEFETTAEYQARLAAAEAARQRLEPEYERKKADRRRAIQEQIEALTGVPYPAPIRISLGTYDADTQTFPFYARATGDSGTIEIPREVAPNIKTNLGMLKQTGYWRLTIGGEERLLAVSVDHRSGTFWGEVDPRLRLFQKILEDMSEYEYLELPPGVPPQLSEQEYARMVKERYPQYSDIEDDDLIRQILLKYGGYIPVLYPEPVVSRYRAAIEADSINIGMDKQFLAAIRSGMPQAAGPSLPPALSAAVSFTEPSGDNVLDADEQAILAITLTNSGQGTAYGVEVALTLRQAQGDSSRA